MSFDGECHVSEFCIRILLPPQLSQGTKLKPAHFQQD